MCRLLTTTRAYVLTDGTGAGHMEEASSPPNRVLIKGGSDPKEMKGSNPGDFGGTESIAWRDGPEGDWCGGESKRKYATLGGLEGDPQTGQLSDRCQRSRSSSGPRGSLPCAQGTPAWATTSTKCPLIRLTSSHMRAWTDPGSAPSTCMTLGKLCWPQHCCREVR